MSIEGIKICKGGRAVEGARLDDVQDAQVSRDDPMDGVGRVVSGTKTEAG
ncbi:MAG: hypothetical protein V3R65_09805 [Acidiferrobacterales bacterium]